MDQVDEIIDELKKFSAGILLIGNPLKEINLIHVFEKKHELTLPLDYKYFIERINGCILMLNEIYPIGMNNLKQQSLEDIYNYEHYEVKVPQFKNLVPFSPDGGGNFYCFDTNQINPDGTCSIVFWVSNYLYTEQDAPEIVNNCFSEFVKEVIIDWTLEDYHYDGSQKTQV